MGFATVTAMSVGAVVSTIGVNTHLDFLNSSYQNLAVTSAAINYLGVKNLRDSYQHAGDQALWAQVAAATGAKFDDYMGEASPAQDSADLAFVPSVAALGLLNFVEGDDEPDDPYAVAQGNSTAAGAAFQSQVYSVGHSLGLPVINMSFGAGWTWTNNWHGDYDKVGDLSPYCDYSNAHTYPVSGQLPDKTIQRLNADALLAASSRPVITTEIGWNTAKFDAQTVAGYVLDAVFDGIKDGDVKLYFYALFDDGSGNFGLMNSDGSPKPAGLALHNLTTILADTGAPRSGSLFYSLSGTTANDYSLLMLKSTGQFELAVWNEVDAAHSVTVTLPKKAARMTIYDPLTSSSAGTTKTGAASTRVMISPNHPMIIEITR
jgi:hypothetical protein